MAEKPTPKKDTLPPGFEEVGDHWEEMAEFKNPGDTVVGLVLEIAPDVGPNKSMVYILNVNGTRTGVWGSTILDRRMKFVEVGEEIAIRYLGKAENPKTGREYHDYKVMRRRSD